MLHLSEYEDKYYNRFYGKRRARVAENQDPKKLGRIRVENVELYGTGVSPWATPCFPMYGGRDSGFFSVPPIGSLVWIECEEGMVEHPIFVGGFYDEITDGHSTDGSAIEESSEYQLESSPVPAHGRADYDGSDYGMKGSFGVPASSYEAEYGEVTIIRTPAGHMLELDDTEGGERVQIFHSKGSHIEILPDGTVNIIAEGNIRSRSTNTVEIIAGDKRQQISGAVSSQVDGDFSTTLNGDVTTKIKRSQTHSASNCSVTIKDNINLTGGGLTATLANLFEVNAGGDFSLSSFGDFEFVGAGTGYLNFNNALSIPEPMYVSESCTIVGTGGTSKFISGDPTQNISVYGVEARGGLGGQVYLGNLTPALRTVTLGLGPVPLTKEPAVMGLQLNLFLNAIVSTLQTFFTALQISGGVTTGFGGPNPVLQAQAILANTALTTAQTTFLTVPSPTQPLILSESVFLSKV